jgi:hypothetical protein
MTNIVVITRGRYTLLEQTLRSLCHHTDSLDYTLTVVADREDDFRVKRLLDAYSDAQVVYLSNSTHKLSDLKKIGVTVSQHTFGEGHYLYLSDNDVYFCKGWLKALTTLAEGTFLQGFRLWGGQNHPYHMPTKYVADLSELGAKEYDMLAGTSWMMHWETWKDLSGNLKSDGPGVCKGEDVALCHTLRAKGLRIAALDPPLVLDCGWTNSDGKPAPGLELRRAVPGVYHE